MPTPAVDFNFQNELTVLTVLHNLRLKLSPPPSLSLPQAISTWIALRPCLTKIKPRAGNEGCYQCYWNSSNQRESGNLPSHLWCHFQRYHRTNLKISSSMQREWQNKADSSRFYSPLPQQSCPAQSYCNCKWAPCLNASPLRTSARNSNKDRLGNGMSNSILWRSTEGCFIQC